MLVCKIWKLVVPLLDECTNWFQLVAWINAWKTHKPSSEHKHTEIWNKQWQFVFTKSTTTNDFARDQQRRCNFNEWMVSKLIEHLLHSFDQNVLIEMSFVLIKLVNIFFQSKFTLNKTWKRTCELAWFLLWLIRVVYISNSKCSDQFVWILIFVIREYKKWFEINGDFIFRQQKIPFHEIDDVHMHNKSGFALNSSEIFETAFFSRNTFYTWSRW